MPCDPPTGDHLWQFLSQNPFSEIHPSFSLIYFLLPLHSLNKYFLFHLFQKKNLMLLVPRFLRSQTPRQLLERKQVLHCIIHYFVPCVCSDEVTLNMEQIYSSPKWPRLTYFHIACNNRFL